MKGFIVLLLLVVVSLAACAPTFQPPSVCQDGASSVIMEVTNGNPTGLDKTLLTVNLVALEKKKYTAAQVEQVLNDVETTLKDGISYAGFKKLLDAKIAAGAMIILGPDIGAVADTGGTKIISVCDRELILAHINHQRAIVALYK